MRAVFILGAKTIEHLLCARYPTKLGGFSGGGHSPSPPSGEHPWSLCPSEALGRAEQTTDPHVGLQSHILCVTFTGESLDILWGKALHVVQRAVSVGSDL